MARDSKKRKKERKARIAQQKLDRANSPSRTGGGPLWARAERARALGLNTFTMGFRDARRGSDTRFDMTFDLSTPHLVPGMSEGQTVPPIKPSPEPAASEGTSD